MVTSLALDIGSSSVKAAVLVGTAPAGPIVRVEFPTQYDGVRAEVRPADILRAASLAARRAIAEAPSKPPDVIGLSTMSPSWVAMDARGEALTPIITHQDRRALAEAREIESAIGRRRHLALTGNRPVPGGISSTTALHFARHHRALLRRAAFVGHLQTLLLLRWTGQPAMDPSNASFTGLWHTTANLIPPDGQSGWLPELIAAAGLRLGQLPPILPADVIAGHLRPGAARSLGVRSGTPILTGLVDTSAAVLLAGARPGMLINNAGSTDVLGIVTEQARPSDRYLTRALGVGRKFLAVATLPAAGSAVVWARRTLFADLTDRAFFTLVHKLAARRVETAVTFDLDLAGSRTSVDQPTGAWRNLRLSTTRDEMLHALLDALAIRSAARLQDLRRAAPMLRRQVLRTGGTGALLADVLYRDWRGHWSFHDVPEATVLGLGQLASGRPI